MIQNELNDFEALEESFHNNKIEAEKKMDEERNEVLREVKRLEA